MKSIREAWVVSVQMMSRSVGWVKPDAQNGPEAMSALKTASGKRWHLNRTNPAFPRRKNRTTVVQALDNLDDHHIRSYRLCAQLPADSLTGLLKKTIFLDRVSDKA